METVAVCLGTFVFSVFCLFFTQISTWFRTRFEKRVQCWFCHAGSRVKYVDSNSWTCSSCGQYNGFTKDGDYNREISGQFDSRLNVSAGTYSKCKPEFKRSNSLCHRCNYNQELKIKQLAAFVPLSEANYDKEIHHYKLQLEQSYKLCSKCEQLVASVISSQKYVLPGPRRLAQLTTRLVLKSYWSLYLSMVLCVAMASNRWLSEVESLKGGMARYVAEPVTGQVLAGLGVILHTLQCCQFGTYWSFVNWLVWAVMASSPHFLQAQLPAHISYIQTAICLSLFTSSLIILVRRKRSENYMRRKEGVRQARRTRENSAAVWSSNPQHIVNHTAGNVSSPVEGNKKRESPSPVKLTPMSSSPKAELKRQTGVDKRGLVRPVARIPETLPRKDDLDISTLSISNRNAPENPFNKGMSPWDRMPMTRCSSFSSGISSLRASPCSWKTTADWRGSPENTWLKGSRVSPPSQEDWTKVPMKESRRGNDSWSPPPSYDYDRSDWDTKKSPWPTQIYSYPVAYAWPEMTPPWDRSTRNSVLSAASTPSKQESNGDGKTSYIFTSLPTIILAATNAFLVYYILNTKT